MKVRLIRKNKLMMRWIKYSICNKKI